MKKTFKNVTVEWNFDFDKKIRDNFSNRQFAEHLNYTIDRLIKPKIEKGLSPVKGERAFQKYKNPKQYPAGQKPSNKPNLKLTGEMLYNYIAKEGKDVMSATVGIHSDAGDEVVTRAKANNFGTQSGKQALAGSIASSTKDKKLKHAAKSIAKGIPARPFIPQDNQSFTADIILEIRKVFAYCLNQAINRGKNK